MGNSPESIIEDQLGELIDPNIVYSPPPPPHPLLKQKCIIIVFDFSRDDFNTREKLETMVMQNLAGRG